MMYQAFSDYPNYAYYWNQFDDLNMNKLHLNATNLYYTNSNHSYEINPDTIYAPNYDLNDYNLYHNFTYDIYQPYKEYLNENNYYEVWNYPKNDYNTNNINNNVRGLAGSLNDDDWSDYSDSDTLEEYNRLFNRKLNEEAYRRLQRNQGCLSILIEGDLIEYLEHENELDEKDIPRYWAIYMGNSMIMRYDNKRKQVIYESYWKIANHYYIFINRDLDKKLITLPIYEILKRARQAHANSTHMNMSKVFSSDKNFAMWCRFDINKSDIDLATDQSKYSSKFAKDYVFQKFFQSLDKSPNAEKLQQNTNHHHYHHHNHHKKK